MNDAKLRSVKDRLRDLVEARRRQRAQADPCPACGRTLFADGVPDTLIMTTTPGQLMSYCPDCESRAREVNPGVEVVIMSTPSRADIRRRLADEYGPEDSV